LDLIDTVKELLMEAKGEVNQALDQMHLFREGRRRPLGDPDQDGWIIKRMLDGRREVREKQRVEVVTSGDPFPIYVNHTDTMDRVKLEVAEEEAIVCYENPAHCADLTEVALLEEAPDDGSFALGSVWGLGWETDTWTAYQTARNGPGALQLNVTGRAAQLRLFFADDYQSEDELGTGVGNSTTVMDNGIDEANRDRQIRDKILVYIHSRHANGTINISPTITISEVRTIAEEQLDLPGPLGEVYLQSADGGATWDADGALLAEADYGDTQVQDTGIRGESTLVE